MSDAQQSITLGSPAFRGLNTQDSPLSLDQSFAAVADNCVLDKYGRLGARKGFSLLTENPSVLGNSAGIEAIYEYINSSGTTIVFSAGNNSIFSGTTTLVDETPSGYTITANNWQIVELANHVYFFQRGHEPLVYSDHEAAVEKIDDHSHSTGTAPQANAVLAAFGRIWCGDITGDKSTLYWSDTLLGVQWSGGTSGSLDLTTVWPDGEDQIVALAEHNGFLVIFGQRSVLVYSGADDPSQMAISDIVRGVGCIDRDTVQSIGSDLLFLSDTGLKGLGRTIQEKSAPLSDFSQNIRDDLIYIASLQTSSIKSEYFPEDALYILSFTETQLCYVFDVRGVLENGAFRVTRWPTLTLESIHRGKSGTLYCGFLEGISEYTGYADLGNSFQLRYYSHPLTFGDLTRLKILKKVIPVLIGGTTVAGTIKWAYDYTDAYRTATFSLANGEVGEYGLAEFNLDEYSAGIVIARPVIHTSGAGTFVTIAIEVTIDGDPISIQQLDVKATIGRAT